MPLKGAEAVLDEFRAGKFGRISLENRKAIYRATAAALLEMTARNRGMLLKGAEADTERAAAAALDEFRAGKFGRISLEKPESDIQGDSGGAA